jgi:hypothetical protein
MEERQANSSIFMTPPSRKAQVLAWASAFFISISYSIDFIV